MHNIEFLAGAYTFIWFILGFYFFKTGRKIKKLEQKVMMLEEEKNDK